MLNKLIPVIDNNIQGLNLKLGLAEIITESGEDGKSYPATYVGNGQYSQIDLELGVGYHRISGDISYQTLLGEDMVGCAEAIELTYPMLFVGYVRLSGACETYSADNFSKSVSSNILQTNITKAIRAEIKASNVRLQVNRISVDRNSVWENEYSGIDPAADFNSVLFSIQYDIKVKASSDCLISICQEESLSAPILVFDSATESSIEIMWLPISSATGYRVDVSALADFSVLIVNGHDNGTLTSYTLTGAESITTYYFRVRAYNTAEEGPNSSILPASTLYLPLTQAFKETVEDNGDSVSSAELLVLNNIIEKNLKGIGTINGAIDLLPGLAAFHYHVGGIADTHRLNFLNTALYPKSYFGGVTHDNNGVRYNGVNGYSEMDLNPSIAFVTQNIGIGYSNRENMTASTGGNYFCGASSVSGPTSSLGVTPNFANGTTTYFGACDDGNSNVSDPSGRGVRIVMRRGGNLLFCVNGPVTTVAYASVGFIPNFKIRFGTLGKIAWNLYRSGQTTAEFVLHDPTNIMTAPRILLLEQIINAADTALNRNVY